MSLKMAISCLSRRVLQRDKLMKSLGHHFVVLKFMCCENFYAPALGPQGAYFFPDVTLADSLKCSPSSNRKLPMFWIVANVRYHSASRLGGRAEKLTAISAWFLPPSFS